MKTVWDLTLLYKNPTDPAIERDAKKIERLYVQFEAKYRGKKNYLSSDVALAKALKDYEKLGEETGDSKPLMYFHYRKELDSEDTEAEGKIRQFGERFTKAGNRLQFFELSLGKLPAPMQRRFLKSKKLAPYRYYLERIFLAAKHDLTEAEEKILSRKAATSRSMWISGVDAVLNRQEVECSDKKIPINEAMGKISTIADTRERHTLHKNVMRALKDVSDFAESEVNAIYTDKKINDELRGFKNPYDATILGYENEAKSVLTLVDTVTKHFHLAHRFYDIKKKLLKLPFLTYADRGVLLSERKTEHSFASSVKTVREAFAAADPIYAKVLDDFLANGQIDVAPKKGKSGGAYCSSATNLPTFVLLNHVDDFRSMMTLAHEMGHAIHSERTSKTQPLFYEGYSTAVAETASTFFEGLAFEHATRNLPDDARLATLHNKLQEDVATVFRQIACFNFERDLHKEVRSKGWVPKKDIALLLNKHMSAYIGDAMQFVEDDGYFFVAWSHIRNFFYVYSYAYGELISKALRARVQKDPSYIAKVDKFLCAGRSKTPEDIFASIGLDVRKPAVFSEGLKQIERDLDELEHLAKNV